MALITQAFKTLYNNRIDLLLADNALTVPCMAVYGDMKYVDCPNCIYDASTGKSSNRYQTGTAATNGLGFTPLTLSELSSLTLTEYIALSLEADTIPGTAGPMPFNQGVCPYCHGAGKLEEEDQDLVYLAIIADSKDWIGWSKGDVTPNTPEMFVQTVSTLPTTITKLKRAKHLVVDTNVAEYNRSRYERYDEPRPAGLGNNRYVLTMWKRIG